jgi:hypothetical protein
VRGEVRNLFLVLESSLFGSWCLQLHSYFFASSNEDLAFVRLTTDERFRSILAIIKTCCALVIKYRNLNHDTVAAIKRQVPFLIGGTITGIIMTYFWGFPITLLVNSTLWYLISLVVYKLVWRKNGLTDQMIILRYVLKKIKHRKSIQRTS